MFLIKNLISAFSMFSSLPMPQVEYNKENTKYMMIFFPIIGLAIGIFMFLWYILCEILGFGNILMSMGLLFIPQIVSGFIHLDGFMDVVDAFSSHKTEEKMLLIMKDSHVGAFAVMGIFTYLSIYFAVFYELKKNESTIVLLGLIFILSRIFSGFVSLKLKKAKKDGMLKSITDNSSYKIVMWCLTLLFFVMEGITFLIDIKAFICILIGALICSFYCCHKIYYNFKGITGDLSGWYLSLNEIVMVFSLLISQKL